MGLAEFSGHIKVRLEKDNAILAPSRGKNGLQWEIFMYLLTIQDVWINIDQYGTITGPTIDWCMPHYITICIYIYVCLCIIHFLHFLVVWSMFYFQPRPEDHHHSLTARWGLRAPNTRSWFLPAALIMGGSLPHYCRFCRLVLDESPMGMKYDDKPRITKVHENGL